MAVSSARPDALVDYGGGMVVESETALKHSDCAAALERLRTTSSAYVGTVDDIDAKAKVAIRLAEELDAWVAAVGQAFIAADPGGGPSLTVDDAKVIQYLPPGLADPPAEVRVKVQQGQDLYDKLAQASEDRDQDRINELLDELRALQDDPAFMAGFATKVEENGGSGDLENMIKDGLQPKKHGGMFGWAIDLGLGAWDSVWGTLTFLEGITTKLLYDPGKFAENWKGLGAGLWNGVTNPIDFLKAVVDIDGLKDNPARWLGSFVPDLVAAVFTDGASTAATGAREGARGLDRIDDLVEAGRVLDRIDDIGDLSRGLDKLGDLAGPIKRLDLDPDLLRVKQSIRESLVTKGLPDDIADNIASRITSGTQFNRDNWSRYPVNELRLSNGKVLDSYDPLKREIVSRKYSQLSDVNLDTAKSYIREITNKYDKGTTIGDSPSVQALEESSGLTLEGTRLDGDLILEVPNQAKAVPREVLEYALDRKVTIRTAEGLVLNPPP